MAASTPELIQLLNALQSKARKWYNIGLQLNLSTDELDIIEADGQGVEDRLRNMLKKCLTKTDPPLTWNTLIRVLKEPAVEEPVLANELERKFVLKSAPIVSTRGHTSPEDASQELQIIREVDDKIKGSFATLLANVLTRLKRMDLDVDSFRVSIVALFQTDSIPKSPSLVEIFEFVTRNGLWDYLHVTPLENIVEQYSSEDPEMSLLVSNYKRELSGYKAATKIIDYMKLCSIRSFADPDDQPLVPNPVKYDSNFYTQLKVKLRIRVADKTLEYVDELWRSLAEYFLLPDLSALLESIQEGCISITWLIPALYAFQISANIQDAEDFFKRMSIIQLKLDEVCVFGSDSEDSEANILLNACLEGSTDEVVELIADGVNVNTLFENGSTPLIIASGKGHLKLVELLLRHGAKVDAIYVNGWTPLMTASRKGYTHVVEVLLKHGANTETKSKTDGLTALFAACKYGYLSVAELLLLYNADVNAQNIDGWTPLMIASNKGHLKIVELLLKHGANVDAKNKDGVTSLITACECGYLSITELLLLYKADVNAQKSTGTTALIQASSFGHLHVVELLLKYNDTSVNIQSKNGWTALSLACYHGNVNIVKVLLSHQADINMLIKDSWSPLMLAVKGGHCDIVSLLLDHQADVNVMNEFGWTALFVAAKNGDFTIIQSLIRHNADLNIKDKNGATAYDVASVHEQRAVCEELEKNGYIGKTDADTENVRRSVVATSHQISGYFADMEKIRIFREEYESVPAMKDIPKHSSTTERESKREL